MVALQDVIAMEYGIPGTRGMTRVSLTGCAIDQKGRRTCDNTGEVVTPWPYAIVYWSSACNWVYA